MVPGSFHSGSRSSATAATLFLGFLFCSEGKQSQNAAEDTGVQFPVSVTNATGELTVAHLTCWCLVCLCSVTASKDPSVASRWSGRVRLQWRPRWRWSVWFVPRCAPLGSAEWEELARPAAGRLAPAVAAACGSAAGGAGPGAPGWLPAPRGWPGSGGCFCSGRKQCQYFSGCN